MINLSKQKLLEEENDVLSRGLNFAIVTNHIPKQQILAEVETGIQRLPENKANLIRNQTINILNQKQKMQSNLTSSEIKTLNNLTKNVEIRICKADKGNSTVILDKTDYDQKMLSLLNDESAYRILNRDSTKCIERRLNSFIYNLFKSQRISQMQYYQLRSTDATAPRLYGLPKIHKKDIPMRSMVSFINSPLYNLSKFLCKLLSPLVGNTEFTVKNSYEFVQFLNSIVLEKNECMVSFDVVSLFTNIPVELAKKVTFDLLKEMIHYVIVPI